MVDHYGFVGLGQMGGPMARNIGKHVPKLYVHDKAGVEPKKSSSNFVTVSKLSDLITKATTIFLSVTDADATLSIAKIILATSNRKTKTVIDLSTIGPEAARNASRLLSKSQIEYIDAPVSGGVIGAKNGSITIMWAGSHESFSFYENILQSFTKNQFYVGNEPGQGQALKILNNFLSGTAMLATSEAIHYGISQGLEMKTMLDVINVSTGQNTATRDKFPDRILTKTFDAGFKTSLLTKDLQLFLKNTQTAGTPNEISKQVTKIWEKCNIALPESDMTQIYNYLKEEDN